MENKTKGGYVKIKGEFLSNIEHSYFIINPQIDEMKSLFKLFKQMGFIFAIKNKESEGMDYQYWEMDDSGNYVKMDESEVDVTKFFSSLKILNLIFLLIISTNPL